MSTFNRSVTPRSAIAPSIISIDQDIPLDPQEGGHFFSISKRYNSKLRKNIMEEKNMDMLYNFRMKTQTRKEKEAEVKQEKTRKTRKDKEGRIFKCGGCSNDYLSYPALYTHIKAKHGGITPEGTMRGQNGKVKKRGRPKSRRNPQTLYERETFEDQFPKKLLNLVDKQKLSVLDEFSIQQQQDKDTQTDISARIFVSQLRIIKKLTHSYLKTMSIVRIMTIFLYNIKDYIEDQTMLNFQAFLQNLLKFINKHYHQSLMSYAHEAGIYINPEKEYTTQKVQTRLLTDLKGNQVEKKQKLYCEHQQPRFMPVFVEEYLRRAQLDDREDFVLEQMFLFDFCKWLFDQKLTTLVIIKNSARFIIREKNQEQGDQ